MAGNVSAGSTGGRIRCFRIINPGKTIQRDLAKGLAYFAHRGANAVREGLNSKTRTINELAHGFHNREHFKTAIFFNG